MRYLLLMVLATVLVCGGCANSSSSSDGGTTDSDTDTDTDTDADTDADTDTDTDTDMHVFLDYGWALCFAKPVSAHCLRRKFDCLSPHLTI